MLSLRFGRHVLGVGLAVALLAGCGGSSQSNASATAAASAAETTATAAVSSVGALRARAVATRPAATPIPSSSWAQLRVGLRVYTGDDGGDATTQTICSTLAAYLSSIDDSNAPRCLHIKRGLPAIVEAVIPSRQSDADAALRAPHVELRAADGSWSGFTTVIPLQPSIPLGTIIVMRKQGNASINLAPRQGSDLDAGPNLGDKVTVKLLHYYPHTGDRSLYVTVLDGSHAGQNGWMFPDGETKDGYSTFTLTYTFVTPAPTIDPMKRTYTLTGKLRVFSDLQTCKDALNAMESDAAYKNLKDAVASGAYHDFNAGDKLHIISDPDPNELWVIVSDDNGNQGCLSRYNLPGY